MPNPINTILQFQFHSLPLLLLLFSTTATDNNNLHHHRRILHQPLYPLETTISPAQPPASSPQYPHFPQQQQPKLPFSTSPQRPFFPTFPSPPSLPPPPPVLATFPANISSLLFPQSPSDASSSSSRHHVLLTISLSVSLLSAALLISLAAFLFLYRKNHHPGPFSSCSSPQKAPHTTTTDTARLFPPDTATSTPKTRNSSNHSRNSPDFLYLGTLSNTQRSNDDASSTNSSSVGSKLTIPGLSSASAYHKIGSPELNPLPPLPRHNFISKSFNAEEEEEEEDEGEEEEFFSPRGSSGRKENLNLTPEHVHTHTHSHAHTHSRSHTHVSSSSRREFSGVVGAGGADPFGSRSFNSRTASYPYSNSISSSRSSVSNTASPPPNLSPQSLKSSSPDTILKFPAPSHLPRPNTPSLRSPSSSSASEPEKDRDEENEEKMKRSSSVRIMPKRIPPPPPPVPPFRFWENPAPAADPPRVMENHQSIGPPVLSVPSMSKGLQSNGSSGEKSEETIPNSNSKPKLKPLHWDKVRSSSDRAMVWDQLRSSSFQ